MIYRVDFQNFITKMIDYFTVDDLTHPQYCVISTRVRNGGKVANCKKFQDFYPDVDIVEAYANTGDKKLLNRMYREMIKPENETNVMRDETVDHFGSLIYNAFLNPMVHHNDVIILCDRSENAYIDALCECLEDYDLKVIDLNELFNTGHLGPISIDMDDINDQAVRLRRLAAHQQKEALSTTKDGRLYLVDRMSKEEKIQELKKMGIKVHKRDKKNLDKMLIDAIIDED